MNKTKLTIAALIGALVIGVSSSPSENKTTEVNGLNAQATTTPASTIHELATPTPLPTNTPIPLPTSTPTPFPTATPATIQQTNGYSGSLSGDKDCSDFSTHAQAQAYFEAKGGSSSNNVDRLDKDSDGIACENLP